MVTLHATLVIFFIVALIYPIKRHIDLLCRHHASYYYLLLICVDQFLIIPIL